MGRPRSRRSRQRAYAKTRTSLWSRPIQIETRRLEKQLEDASYLTLKKLRLTYGFTDYTLTPNHNAAQQLAQCPRGFILADPLTLPTTIYVP
jgi:hypothetical protein